MNAVWPRRLLRPPIQVQSGVCRDQCERIADLVEARRDQKIAMAPIALGPQDVVIRLWLTQGLRAAADLPVAFERKSVPGRGGEGRIALLNLQLAVEHAVGRVAD